MYQEKSYCVRLPAIFIVNDLIAGQLPTCLAEFIPLQSTTSCTITNRSKTKVILKNSSKIFSPKYSLSSDKLLIAHLSLSLLTKIPLWSHHDLQYLNSDSLTPLASFWCQLSLPDGSPSPSLQRECLMFRSPLHPWSSIHDNFLNFSPTVSYSKQSSIIGENDKIVMCKHVPNSLSLFLFKIILYSLLFLFFFFFLLKLSHTPVLNLAVPHHTG